MDRELSQQYAPSIAPGSRGGLIASVVEGSPAYVAGLRAGMTIERVDGQELADLIDWYWLSCEEEICVEGFAPVELLGDSADNYDESELASGVVDFEVDLERMPGEEWGIAFADAIFDKVRTCCNTCTFCFMTMLPHGMRPALYLRDDDYRLSFLQGNFVTLTNMTDEDAERVVRCGLSPLHVSLHAISADVREKLIGCNERVGVTVLETLLAQGIEVHTQIVLVPDVNDGDELERTLSWIEKRPGVLSCGIVPLGFTQFQDRFSASFNEPSRARAVIEQVRPYQERARASVGTTRFHLADEFYLNAGVTPPDASWYDGFPQYEDGIGMVRSFLDAWDASAERIEELACRLRAYESAVVLASGEAFARLVSPLLESAGLIDAGISLVPVANRFFGGNVDVAGLLTATDVIEALSAAAPGPVLLPAVMLNGDGLTLDGRTPDELRRLSGRHISMVSCTVEGLLSALEDIVTLDGVSEA